KRKLWTAEDHLNLLLSPDALAPSDTTSPDEQNIDLPTWFDEEKFARGQKYYYKNSYGMFVGKLCGLIAVLAVPTILRILMFTQRSSVPFTAYKRYIATLLHTTLWYDIKLTKDSRSWKSLIQVRKRHFQAGQSACAKGLGSVTQKDLALTQFGFMGFILIRPKFLGIQCDDKKDREAFVHVWRCVGYMMGLEDRFNICRDSLEETEDLCEVLLAKYFAPLLSTYNKDFEDMSKALLEGMWTFNPFIHFTTFMYFTRRLSGVPEYKFPLPNIVDNQKIGKTMHWYPKALLFFMIYVLETTLDKIPESEITSKVIVSESSSQFELMYEIKAGVFSDKSLNKGLRTIRDKNFEFETINGFCLIWTKNANSNG
ncbi:uncharacterized protein LOC113381812, partial [Ctenocephalides felis]|uniref:uncharacterized protein LOC113381812 n=1 Tax=Ctenocephalides felis TaxID=7515 RepID=UPI000E6E208E